MNVNFLKKAFTVALWITFAGTLYLLAYLFGGHAYLANNVVDLPDNYGLALAVVQIVMIVVGFASAPFALIRLIGAIGFTAKHGNIFGITAIVPCLPLAVAYTVTGMLGYEFILACAIVLFILAVCEVAVFILGIITIKNNRKQPSEPAAENN